MKKTLILILILSVLRCLAGDNGRRPSKEEFTKQLKEKYQNKQNMKKRRHDRKLHEMRRVQELESLKATDMDKYLKEKKRMDEIMENNFKNAEEMQKKREEYWNNLEYASPKKYFELKAKYKKAEAKKKMIEENYVNRKMERLQKLAETDPGEYAKELDQLNRFKERKERRKYDVQRNMFRKAFRISENL